MANKKRMDWKTWWYYNKIIVIAVGAVLFVLLDVAAGQLRRERPDVQIAYVGEAALPEDTVKALCQTLEAFAADLNGGRKAVVHLNQYPTAVSEGDGESYAALYGMEARLMADLLDCESYFFLLEDPDAFQRKYESLALPDGSCPPEGDRDGVSKTLRWEDCPALASLPLGRYEETVFGQVSTGDSQERLGKLYFGRRCFYDGKTVRNAEGCAALWDKLTEGGRT